MSNNGEQHTYQSQQNIETIISKGQLENQFLFLDSEIFYLVWELEECSPKFNDFSSYLIHIFKIENDGGIVSKK